jgi:hypothetical protein
MNVQSMASRQARVAPAANFTGSVYQDPLARADGTSKTGCDNEYWPTCADEYWPTPRCLIC